MDVDQEAAKAIFQKLGANLSGTGYNVEDLLDYDFLVTHDTRPDLGLMVQEGFIRVCFARDERNPVDWDKIFVMKPSPRHVPKSSTAHALAGLIKSLPTK